MNTLRLARLKRTTNEMSRLKKSCKSVAEKGIPTSCYPSVSAFVLASKFMNRKIVYIAAVLLAILHQDFWLWDSTTLLFGFLPVGLAYHAGYSLLAALLWYGALHFAWPEDVVRFAEGEDSPASDEKGERR